MKFISTPIEGVVIIEPQRFGDARGYFMETFRLDEFKTNVGDVDFVQDNESFSTYGVVRGLHFQEGPFSQAKLMRVSLGCVLDVAVDLRHDSPTFGHHIAVELSEENARQLYIPRGFAHGFAVLSPTARFHYKVDNFYAPHSERSLRFDDPALGIDWRIPRDKMLLSAKDLAALPFDLIPKF